MRGIADRRLSGVLLHPSSLPGGAIGDLGAGAWAFVDWLASAGQSFWQILPLVAVDDGGSPYNGLSAVAGNPLLISLEELVPDGLLCEDESRFPDSPPAIDFPMVTRWKGERLALAYDRLRVGRAPHLLEAVEKYRERNATWLEDYALFRALRSAHGGATWSEWEPEIRAREPEALARVRRDLAEEIGSVAFQQFLFDRQWSALRAYANGKGIRIIGDVPIFVAYDSADVWAHQDLFKLDADGRPEVVSGVPPDYFSETGQRWGNPLFRWDGMREGDYGWWVERFRRTLSWVDVVRIDHFRGFEAYWQIPATEETAVHGEWEPGPGAQFFRSVEEQLGELPVIAEDLGLITEGVDALRDELGYPGMRVLEFAFDGDPANPHLPDNYPENTVAYTGTHDNDTVVGWWAQAALEERAAAGDWVEADGRPIQWRLMQLLYDSRARLVVVPVQDVLGMGSEARMNTPGTSRGNWTWRLREGELTETAAAELLTLTEQSGRLPRTLSAGVAPPSRRSANE